MHDLVFIFAGFLVGIVLGLSGAGVRSLMPATLILLRVKPYLAFGTDLLLAPFTRLGGSIKLAHTRERVSRSLLCVLPACAGVKLIAA